MKPARLLLSLISTITMLVVGTSAFSQASTTVKQAAEQSICSNVVTLTGNTNVNCSNLTAAQKRAIEEIPKIMKMALDSQKFLQSIQDEIQKVKSNCENKSTINLHNSPVTGGSGNGIESADTLCLDATDSAIKGGTDGIKIGSPTPIPDTAPPAPAQPTPQANNASPPTGISADPNCKDKVRIHFSGGALSGGVDGLRINDPNVCVEVNGMPIVGGSNGVSVAGHTTPIGDSKTIWMAAPGSDPNALPDNDERRKKGMELVEKYVKAHPDTTPQELVDEINKECIELGIDAHITWTPPSPY
jgi:hypothetical protein